MFREITILSWVGCFMSVQKNGACSVIVVLYSGYHSPINAAIAAVEKPITSYTGSQDPQHRPQGRESIVSRSTEARDGWQGWRLPVSASYLSLLVLIFLGEVYGLCIGEDLNGSTLYQTLNLGKSMPQLFPLCYIWRVWCKDCINS